MINVKFRYTHTHTYKHACIDTKAPSFEYKGGHQPGLKAKEEVGRKRGWPVLSDLFTSTYTSGIRPNLGPLTPVKRGSADTYKRQWPFNAGLNACCLHYIWRLLISMNWWWALGGSASIGWTLELPGRVQKKQAYRVQLGTGGRGVRPVNKSEMNRSLDLHWKVVGTSGGWRKVCG